MQANIRTVKTIIDAIPYIKEFSQKTFVIKYGGAAWENEELRRKFAQDILLLYLVGVRPIIVHGGGKNITKLHNDLSVDTSFKDGLRVTSKESMKIAQMVLRGEINSEIVSLLNLVGAKAIGLSGKDAHFVKAKRLREDLGYTGEIKSVSTEILYSLIRDKFIPVIAPIAASDDDDELGFNINADSMASAIAKELKAQKVIFLTDTKGVLNKDGKLLHTLDNEQIKSLISDGTIHGGMIPKVNSCLECVQNGVAKAHIIDGRVEHSMLLEIFTTQGIGTQIIGGQNATTR